MSDTGLTAEEQQQFDQMRADDAAAPPVAPTAPAPETSQAEQQAHEPPAEPDKRPQMVPHAALHEERERRKEAEQRARVLEERTNLILQRFAAPPPAPQAATPETAAAPPPPINEDPLGHILGTIRQQNDTIAALRANAEQGMQQQQQAAVVQQLQNFAVGAEQEFRRSAPDYDAAVAHLRTQRDAELQHAGFNDPGQRAAVLAQEALGIVARAAQLGKNPAEMIYEISKFRGYAAPAAAAATAQAAAASPAAPSPAERLDRLSQGQQQSRSLSQARGTGPTPMTAQRLVEMKDSEFSALLDKASPEDLAEYFGA